MFITLQKPSLTYRNADASLPAMTIFTNELDSLTRTGLTEHLIRNKKLALLHFNEKDLTPYHEIRIMTAHHTSNIIIDRYLEEDQDFSKCKIDYPIILEILILNLKECINSFTTEFTIGGNLEVEHKISEGSFSEIFMARQTVSRAHRCIKRINKAECEKKGQLSFIANQFDVLSKISCNQFIRLYYAFEDKFYAYFVLEMCPYGDLYSEINNNFEGISLRQKYYWFTQICLAIGRLHYCGYLYRDLKPENVLIDYQGNAKLCDFGFACKYDPQKGLLNQVCGSYEYIPPELVNREGYNHSFDLYCLGLLFYELLTGVNPFKGVTPKTLSEILKRQVIYDKNVIPLQAKQLIQGLLQKDPKKRVGYNNPAELFQHRFFTQNSEIVTMAIKRDPPDQRQMVYKISKREITEHPDTVKSKRALPELSYNYLQTQINMREMFGPKLVPI